MRAVLLFIYALIAHVAGICDDYWTLRAQFIAEETNRSVGASLQLNNVEQIVNDHLMQLKHKEIDDGLKNPDKFLPAMHFFDSKPFIEQSPVFKFIQRMPKGALLHGHDTALASEPYMYNLTFSDNLYACVTKNETDIVYFKFFRAAPISPPECQWKLIKTWRETSTNVTALNQFIRSKLSLIDVDPLRKNKDINEIWAEFAAIFGRITPMLTYRPVFEDQYRQVLKELYDDNVKYLEMRGTLPTVYELNGTEYGPIKVVGIYKRVTDEFVKTHPDFYGAKFIYGPSRNVCPLDVEEYIKTTVTLFETYPDFFAGFDLVGQEDLGQPLESFIKQLLQLPQDIKTFFHAGETNWNGLTDLNLIDAVLLQATRIGHGYALLKHPKVLDEVRSQRIALEVNPISNQVLKLVDDLRNHPGAVFIAQGLPVVISADDPGFWGAKGLSYDMYITFMGLASRDNDLRLLKQLALNSLLFSAIPADEKGQIVARWHREWNEFVLRMVEENRLDDDNLLNDVKFEPWAVARRRYFSKTD